MRKKTLIASLLAIVIAGGALVGGMAAYAAETTAAMVGTDTPGPLKLFLSGQIGRLLMLRAELNLTAEQREAIRQIVQTHKTEIAGVLKPLVERRRELHEAVIAEPTDEKQIRAASDNLAGSIGDAAVVAAKVRAQVWQVLTPDQRLKIQAFRKDTAQSVDEALDRFANQP